MFEQLRENTTAKMTGAVLAAGLALGLAGCAQEETPQAPSTSEQTETPTYSEDNPKTFESVRESLQKDHDGTVAGFRGVLSQNMDAMKDHLFIDDVEGKNAQDYNIFITGSEIYCADALNYDSENYFEEYGINPYDARDKTKYRCSNTIESTMFLTYGDQIERVANDESVMPRGIDPAVAAGLLVESGDQLLQADSNDGYDRDDIIDSMLWSWKLSPWGGTMPSDYSETEARGIVERVFDTAREDIFGVTEFAPSGDTPSVEEPTQPTDTPEVSSGAMSTIPLSEMVMAYDNAVAMSDVTIPLVRDGQEVYLDCSGMVGQGCTEVQEKVYSVAMLYGDTVMMDTGGQIPYNVVFASLFSILQQEKDPALLEKGGLETYSLDLFQADVEKYGGTPIDTQTAEQVFGLFGLISHQ